VKAATASAARRRSWRGVSTTLLVGLLTQTGCYDWVAVPPGQAESLARFTMPAHPESVALARPDGEVVTLAGNFDLRVHLTSGEVLEFGDPVSVEPENDALVFVTRHREPARVKRDQIAWMEASYLDKGKTVAAVTLASVLGTATVVAIVALVVSQSAQNEQFSLE
jgi:hypothetical protein